MPTEPVLRLLHCIPSVDGGGAETQVSLLAPLLAERGFEVHLAARFTDERRAYLSARGVICHSLPRHIDPRFIPAVWRTVRKISPDLVHAWLTPAIIAAGAAASHEGVPWVLSECSAPACYRPSVKEWLRQRVGRSAAAVAASGKAGFDVWPEAANRTLVPSAVDITRFAKATPARDFDGRFVIVSACRLVASKRVDLLIKAIADIPDAILILLGDGPERERLKQLGGQVLFLGHRPDVERWLKCADVFASASEYEGLPSAVLEAAAAGTPLLLSDIPPHREAAGSGALFVAPEQFADGLRRLRADRTLGARLARLAMKHIRPFAADTVTEQLLETYRLVLGAGRVPDHVAYALRKVA